MGIEVLEATMKTSAFIIAVSLAAGSAQAQVQVLAYAKLDRTYQLTNMECPVNGLESTRVVVSLAQSKDDDIRRGCYEIDDRKDTVVIFWFEDDPKNPIRRRIPLNKFMMRGQ